MSDAGNSGVDGGQVDEPSGDVATEPVVGSPGSELVLTIQQVTADGSPVVRPGLGCIQGTYLSELSTPVHSLTRW